SARGLVVVRDKCIQVEDRPPEDDLSQVRNSVAPLEIAVTERVAVLDPLHGDVHDVTEPQRGEVTAEATDTGVGAGVGLTGNGLGHGSRKPGEAAQSRTHVQLRVNAAAVVAASNGQLVHQARVESEPREVVVSVHDLLVTGPQIHTRVRLGQSLPVSGLVQILDTGDSATGRSLNTVEHGQVNLASQSTGQLARQRTQHTGRVGQDRLQGELQAHHSLDRPHDLCAVLDLAVRLVLALT